MAATPSASLLSKAKSGFILKPQIYVIHSAPKVGKTTFASKFPKPFFADLENGSLNVDVMRLTSDDLPDYQSVLALIEELTVGKHDYQTFVIDSATVLESYIHRYLCGEKYKYIDDYMGGYGQGYDAAKAEVHALMYGKLRKLAERMTVIILAHSEVKKFTDPVSNATYERYLLQMNQKAAGVMISAADNIFFLKHEVSTTVDSKTKKTQAFSDGERKMMTEWRASYDAGNRLNLPPELPLDYDAFIKAVEIAKPRSADELIKDITELLAKVDADTKELASAKMKEVGKDQAALTRIKQKLMTMVKP